MVPPPHPGLALSPMTLDDLELVRGWLAEPHVARWFLAGSSVEDQVAALVRLVRSAHPGAGIVADPEAANVASRRVLEKNGFELLAERPVASEPTGAVMAVYRLPPAPAG